jgi:hypothetical protein
LRRPRLPTHLKPSSSMNLKSTHSNISTWTLAKCTRDIT